MKIVNGKERQRDGSHLLCANIACRIPLERPLRFAVAQWRGGEICFFICGDCLLRLNDSPVVEVTHERYS